MRSASTTWLSSRAVRNAGATSALCAAALLASTVAHADDTPVANDPGTTSITADPATAGAAPAAPASSDTPAPAEAAPAPPGPPPPAWTGAATMGVASLPRVLSLEALVLKRRESDPRFFHFGFGAGIEYLPKGLIQFGPKTDFSWLQFGVDDRFHPWR